MHNSKNALVNLRQETDNKIEKETNTRRDGGRAFCHYSQINAKYHYNVSLLLFLPTKL